MEPCNYASNIAYYHSALRVCDYPQWAGFNRTQVRDIKRGFVTLAAGSAFMHGSHTDLGADYDNDSISVIVWTAYRAIIEKLNVTDNALLSLSDDDVAISGHNLTEQYSFFSEKMPISNWSEEIRTLQSEFPYDYFKLFGGLIESLIYLTFPYSIGDKLLPILENTLLSASDATFFRSKFAPAIKEALKNIHLPFIVNAVIHVKLVGVLIKIIWAFVW